MPAARPRARSGTSRSGPAQPVEEGVTSRSPGARAAPRRERGLETGESGQTNGQTRRRSQTGRGFPVGREMLMGPLRPPVWGPLGRSRDSGAHPGNVVPGESDPSGLGQRRCPPPSELRWDKAMRGGQAGIKKVRTGGKKDGGTDRQQAARGKGVREKEGAGERLSEFCYAPGLWGNLPLDGGEWAGPATAPKCGPCSCSRPSPARRARAERTAASRALSPRDPGVGSRSPAGRSRGAAPGRRTHRRARSSGRAPRSLGTCPGLAARWVSVGSSGSESPAPRGVFSFYE